MEIARKSQYSGEWNVMELDITQEQLDAYEDGEGRIQDILPNLSPDEREFLMTGITPEEWKQIFG